MKIETKPGTVLINNESDTLENDYAKIRRCTTMTEIDEQSAILLQKLRELKSDKFDKKRDISGDYEDLKIKLAIVKETKEKILTIGKPN